MLVIQRLFYVFFLCFTVVSCATIAAPEGGPKDTIPPLLDTLNSTANEQVNFVKQPIALTFQEWVLLEDVNNQVLTSPPLEFRPQIKLKRRTVLFEFDEREQLRPNVTYTINFGNGVKDLTEKNPAENLRFVFATGPKLDSLSLQGTLVDVLTGEPIEKALFMLYENLSDSVVRKERPLYFGKTDKEGRFAIKNIREGAFKAFALAEVNSNYRFDLPNEKIGFPDTLIRMDLGIRHNLRLPLFVEAPRTRVTGVDTTGRGLLKIAFNKRPESVVLVPSDSTARIRQSIEKDTLLVWLSPGLPAMEIIVRQDTIDLDTIILASDSIQNAPFPKAGLLTPRPEQRNFRQHPERDLILRFQTPIDTVDASKVRLLADTLLEEVPHQLRIDSTDARLVHVRHSWRENIPYRLEIPADAVLDIYGQGLDSTTVLTCIPDQRKNYGNLQLRITGLNSKMSYVLELLLPDGSIQLSSVVPAGSDTAALEFRALTPQAYTLRLVEDRNNNGIWDTGSYAEKRQPERIFLRKLEALRPNWDVEAEVKIE